MGIPQIALALVLFGLLTGVGLAEVAQYAQAKLPYTLAQRIVQAANAVNNAASAYIVQNTNCITNGANGSGCNLSMNNIEAQGILPSYSGTGSGVNTTTGLFTLSDGTTIGVTATGQTTYNLTITPGAAVRAKTSYMVAVANALPATTIAGSVLTTAETTPLYAGGLDKYWGSPPLFREPQHRLDLFRLDQHEWTTNLGDLLWNEYWLGCVVT